MLGAPTPAAPVRGLVRRVRAWPVASQQQARRNAMVAATACAQRRAERQEVADFLAGRQDRAVDGVTPADAAGATDGRAAHR